MRRLLVLILLLIKYFSLPIRMTLTPQRSKLLSSLFFQVISAALSKIRLGLGTAGAGYQELDLDTDWLLEKLATVKTPIFCVWCLVWVSDRRRFHGQNGHSRPSI